MGFTAFERNEDRYRWSGVEVKSYPGGGTQSRGACKQVLFAAEHGLHSELRYFELEPGGYSALERHEHVHAVLILRGRGRAVLDTRVVDVAEHDLVYVEPNTWHQFLAGADSYLGFLCAVNNERDRPCRPSEDDIARLERIPEVSLAIRY